MPKPGVKRQARQSLAVGGDPPLLQCPQGGQKCPRFTERPFRWSRQERQIARPPLRQFQRQYRFGEWGELRERFHGLGRDMRRQFPIAVHFQQSRPPNSDIGHAGPGLQCLPSPLVAATTERLAHGYGADAILVPTANWLDTVNTRLVPARAEENGTYVVYANYWGPEGDKRYCGQSCVVDPWGNDVLRMGEGERILVGDMTAGAAATARAQIDYLAQRRPALYD